MDQRESSAFKANRAFMMPEESHHTEWKSRAETVQRLYSAVYSGAAENITICK